jgi:hypothetical protein
MSRLSSLIRLRDLTKVFIWAGIFLVGLAVSGAQAATVTSYRSGNTGTVGPGVGGATQWGIDAGGLGPIGLETFAANVGNPPTFADYAFGRINFGDSPGNFAMSGQPLLGSVTGGALVDRADNSSFGPAIHPFIEFSGLGVMAFGANFDLGPNTPGTGLSFLVTFVDGSTQDLSAAILNPSSAVGFQGFFGIVANTVAIRSILFNEGGQFTCPGTDCKDFETFSMTNVQYVSAVPIPAALPLFLSAIAALGFFGRRKLKAAV